MSPPDPGDRPSRALERWFVFHFFANTLTAVQLFVAPKWFLGQFGWKTVDPATARLVGAALLGIGIQSLIGRAEVRRAMIAMVNIKAIWSGFAVLGLLWFQLDGGPPGGWAFVGVLAGFHCLWLYWRVQLARPARAG
jgi:hypothetical protein